MFRYRCPHCTKLLQALEIRAGKTTVCSKCSQPLTIPADKTDWLNERGESLLGSPTVVITAAPSAFDSHAFDETPLDPGPAAEADNDVLGAIFVGEFGPMRGSPSEDFNLDVGTPAPMSSALSALLGESGVGITRAAADHRAPPADPVVLPYVPATAEASPPEEAPAPSDYADPEPLRSVAALEVEEPAAAARVEDHAPPAWAYEPAPPEPVDVEPAAEPFPVWSRAESSPPPPDAEPPADDRVTDESVAEVPVPVAAVVAEPADEPPAYRPPPRRPAATRPVTRSSGGERSVGAAEPAAGPVTPAPVWGVVPEATPAPRRRLVSTLPAPPRRAAAGAVSFDPVDQLRNQMTVAADLTAAITSRMKPPRRVRRDLLPSTALWLLATGAALGLIAATLLTQQTFTRAAATLGLAEVAAGYAWIVWLTYRRDWQRGAACVVPPVTFWFLGQRKYAKFRPLRFVATGVVVVLLASAANYAQAHTRTWAGVADPNTPPPPTADITRESKLAQLRYYRDERAYDDLIGTLRTLSGTDATYSQDANDRAELTAELKALCGHKDSDVKIEAMKAYAMWGGAAARDLCLAATRSTAQEERVAALKLLSRWKDAEVARAVASRIGRPGTETSEAQKTLVQIGGPVAERAAIPLLQDGNAQGVRLIAMEILGDDNVGGAEAVEALRHAAATSADPGTRQPAAAKADRIEARQKK